MILAVIALVSCIFDFLTIDEKHDSLVNLAVVFYGWLLPHATVHSHAYDATHPHLTVTSSATEAAGASSENCDSLVSLPPLRPSVCNPLFRSNTYQAVTNSSDGLEIGAI